MVNYSKFMAREIANNLAETKVQGIDGYSFSEEKNGTAEFTVDINAPGFEETIVNRITLGCFSGCFYGETTVVWEKRIPQKYKKKIDSIIEYINDEWLDYGEFFVSEEQDFLTLYYQYRDFFDEEDMRDEDCSDEKDEFICSMVSGGLGAFGGLKLSLNYIFEGVSVEEAIKRNPIVSGIGF